MEIRGFKSQLIEMVGVSVKRFFFPFESILPLGSRRANIYGYLAIVTMAIPLGIYSKYASDERLAVLESQTELREHYSPVPPPNDLISGYEESEDK